VFNNSLAFAGTYSSVGRELWFYTPVEATAVDYIATLGGIQVYPNPFNDAITLSGLQNGQEYCLTLNDVLGRAISQYHLAARGTIGSLYLPAKIARGTYLLKLTAGETNETLRIVKQ